MSLKEVCIEVTSKCNLKCKGCFNSFSKAHHTRLDELRIEHISHVLNEAQELQIPLVRITGGEPTIHSQLIEIFRLKKNFSQLHFRMNTNGIHLEKVRSTMESIDSYHISLNGIDNESDFAWSGLQNSFDKKIRTIEMLKKNNKVIRIGTVLNQSNIIKLKEFYSFIEGLGIDRWELYRPISLRGENFFLHNLENIAVNLAFFSYKRKEAIQIANAIPFCALNDKKILSEISVGALYDDGHCRLIVDPSFQVKPSYYIDTQLSDGFHLKDAINSDYRKKLLSYEFLPEACRSCNFLDKCKGGSRFKSFVTNKSFHGKDPLMLFP